MTVKAKFDGNVFVPESKVDLPVGQVVLIDIEPENTDRTDGTDLLAKLLAMPADPDWPADGSIQHDHYLYGLPKQQ